MTAESPEKNLRLKKKLAKPVQGISPGKMSGLSDLMYAYEKMSFQARSLGRAAALFTRMNSEPGLFKVMTLSGALVPGGLRQAIMEAIEHRLVDVIVSTGANISHDLVEGMGFHHYQECNFKSDRELKHAFVDRIYDTYINDEDFQATADEVERNVDRLDGVTSDAVCRWLGSFVRQPCILKSAYEHGVPIFVPALNDCELGLVLNHYNHLNKGKKKVVWDGLEDNFRFARIIKEAKAYGILICGGGVPRNWAQQVTPLLEYLAYVPGKWVINFPGYKYGIQITTDTPVYGGLSGCTFSESISWGKYLDDAEYVTVNCDVTIALPLIIGATIERVCRR